MEYDNTNTGKLFATDPEKLKQNPKYPNLTGSININGVEHWLSAWTKTSEKGTKWISISIGDKKEKQPEQKKTYVENGAGEVKEFEDNIPF